MERSNSTRSTLLFVAAGAWDVPAAELAHQDATELVIAGSMHDRKRMMAERADAFAVLPGGIGTLDETFEIITWRQLGLHDKAIFLVDVAGYWGPLRALLDQVVTAGFAPPGARDLYRIVSSVDDVLPLLKRLPEPSLTPKSLLS